MTNSDRFTIDYEAIGDQPGRRYRQARFKTRHAAEKAIHRLEDAPEHWTNIRRRYPTPDYNDEVWLGGWEDIGIVGVATFIYDDAAKVYDRSPVRLMVEDDEGLAEVWLTVQTAEQVYGKLGEAIQRAKNAREAVTSGAAS
jgi:hypothetical protein